MSFHQINWKLCRYFDNQSLSFFFKRITKNLGASRWGSIHDRERFRWWLGSQCPWREGELSRSFEPTALLLKIINQGWYLQKLWYKIFIFIKNAPLYLTSLLTSSEIMSSSHSRSMTPMTFVVTFILNLQAVTGEKGWELLLLFRQDSRVYLKLSL